MVTACPGCGLRLPASQGPTHPYMTGSPACWETFGRVLAREYGDPAPLPTHRLSVDAYAVQHPGGTDRQSVQSVPLHLVRLHLIPTAVDFDSFRERPLASAEARRRACGERL